MPPHEWEQDSHPMKTYLIEVTTKRLLKVTANTQNEAMAKAYQMLTQFKQADVEPVNDLTITIELKEEPL